MKRFTKEQRRRVFTPLRKKAHDTRKLIKRLLGHHLRWSALAAKPEHTPQAAVMLYAYEMRK